MSPRLDAHLHFFSPGFVGTLPPSCRRVAPDEFTLYQALAAQHDIVGALVVGFEGEPWAAGNNAYLADLARDHLQFGRAIFQSWRSEGSPGAARAWVHPVAYVTDPAALTLDDLRAWQQQGFVGISLYLFDANAIDSLQRAAPAVWAWLADQGWLISVNSTGQWWAAWESILARYPTLRLLIAHLGLPPAQAAPPDAATARSLLAPVLALAAAPGVHVKLSGFYALSDPGHDYPHRAAWPYVTALADAYSPQRLVWASDFSPALEVVSFAQTVDVLTANPGFTPAELQAIYHDILAALLATVARSATRSIP